MNNIDFTTKMGRDDSEYNTSSTVDSLFPVEGSLRQLSVSGQAHTISWRRTVSRRIVGRDSARLGLTTRRDKWVTVAGYHSIFYEKDLAILTRHFSGSTFYYVTGPRAIVVDLQGAANGKSVRADKTTIIIMRERERERDDPQYYKWQLKMY